MKTVSSHVRLAAIGMVGILVLMLGCSKRKKSPPVAVVGQMEIGAEEITDILSREGRLFLSAEEELAEKQRLLDSIVETKLLLGEAYRLKLDQDSLILAFNEQERPLFLIDLLYYREVRDKARLSNADVSRYHRTFRVNRCFKQILGTNLRVVDSLSALVRKGASFDSLAILYSKDPRSTAKGGDIGCYGWSRKLPTPVLEKTAELKPGDLAGPFQLPEGWLLLQCYEERPAELPDIIVFERELRSLLEPERETRRSVEFISEVRKNLGFRIVDSTARFVNLKQQELSRVSTPGQPERYSVYLNLEKLTPAERGMPLITFKGGTISAGQYLETLQGTMPRFRPIVDTTERNQALLFQLVFGDAMIQTAVSKGLDKDPQFVILLKQAVEGQMAQLCKSRMLSEVRVDTTRVRAYYRAHPEEFVQAASVHLFEISSPSRDNILALKQNIGNKDQFLSAASQLTSRVRLRPVNGDLGWVEQHQFPELFAAAAKMKAGEIAGPIPQADGSFSLIYLEARRPARKLGFAEVKDGLLQRLGTEAQDSVLDAWIGGQKKRIKVTVFPEVLQKTIDQNYYAKLKEWQGKLKGGIS